MTTPKPDAATPRPWRFNRDNGTIEAGKDRTVALMTTQNERGLADASLLVRSVNNAALVDELVDAIDTYMAATGHVTGVEPQRRALIAALAKLDKQS